MAKEQEVERKNKSWMNTVISQQKKQTVSPLRDYSHTLCRTVKPLIITMTQHEKDFPLEKKNQPLYLIRSLFS